MLIAIIGENCVGKSTLANKINERINCKIYSGKDYLRLDKNTKNAEQKFKRTLLEAITGENVIYLITEKEHLSFIPNGAIKIVLTADIGVIKERFKARMRGVLPAPVEKMLESKHGVFDDYPCEIKLKDGEYSIADLSSIIYR